MPTGVLSSCFKENINVRVSTTAKKKKIHRNKITSLKTQPHMCDPVSKKRALEVLTRPASPPHSDGSDH